MNHFKIGKNGDFEGQGFYSEHHPDTEHIFMKVFENNIEHTELLIDLENIVMKHANDLERLVRYSTRGILTPTQFTEELKKLQIKTLSRCINRLPESDQKEVKRNFFNIKD